MIAVSKVEKIFRTKEMSGWENYIWNYENATIVGVSYMAVFITKNPVHRASLKDFSTGKLLGGLNRKTLSPVENEKPPDFNMLLQTDSSHYDVMELKEEICAYNTVLPRKGEYISLEVATKVEKLRRFMFLPRIWIPKDKEAVNFYIVSSDMLIVFTPANIYDIGMGGEK